MGIGIGIEVWGLGIRIWDFELGCRIWYRDMGLGLGIGMQGNDGRSIFWIRIRIGVLLFVHYSICSYEMRFEHV